METNSIETAEQILILFAHPALQRSRFNKAMIGEVKGLSGVTVHDLYQAYPDFDIDIDYEQKLVEEHDIIVLQHPLLWYSSPALVKEWLDMVLEHDWAYGQNGTALHDKKFLQAVTTGANESSYSKDGLNVYNIRETLAPFAMMAKLCGMEYLPPFVIHGTHSLGQDDIDLRAKEYKRFIVALRDGAIDFEKAKTYIRINSDMEAIIKPGYRLIMTGDFLSQAVIYLAAAVVSVPLSKRLGLGSVLGYLIAGIIVGPFGLGLVGEEREQVMHFAEFGVVMMLFLIGLELQPSLLWRMRGPILGLGGLQVVGTSMALGGVALWFGQPWQSAAAIGMTLALSSTAITLQTLNEKGLMQTDGGQSSFAVLLFQDIAVIPMLALFPALAIYTATTASSDGHASHTWIGALPAWAQALAVLAVISAIVVAGRFVVSYIFRFIAKSGLREIFTAAALLLIVGIALLMTGLGLSPALGTFLAGVVLANSEYRHELEADIEPFKGLLLGLFFIAIGASIDFGMVVSQPVMIGGLVATLIIGKFLLLLILGRIFTLSFDQCLLFAFALAQGGEFAFVLFSFAEQSGVLTSEITGGGGGGGGGGP